MKNTSDTADFAFNSEFSLSRPLPLSQRRLKLIIEDALMTGGKMYENL
jgi:hypothetical protein